MIISIDSSIPTFKRIEFHTGLNVLLSDKNPESTDKQTRNSGGKTSTIEILHFLLGSKCEKDSIFRSEELIEHTFKAELSLGKEYFSIERSGSEPSKIYILNTLKDQDRYPLRTDKNKDCQYISNENWKLLLGNRLFRLPEKIKGTIFEKAYTPTFRSLISYFIRRHKSGGFLSPERNSEKQQNWDWQQSLSYLLNLDWEISHDFQDIRLREKALDSLKKAAKIGAIGNIIGTVAELRSQVTVAEKKAEQRRKQLSNFKVLDSYNEFSKRVAEYKTRIQEIQRDVISLRETLKHLESALASETPPDIAELEAVYASVGIELPDVAVRHLDEVSIFYESVIRNRSLHLQREISEVRKKIVGHESMAKTLDQTRSQILKKLESRGAFDDLLELQKELAELEAEAANLKQRFETAEKLEGEATQLDIDRVNLKRRLQEDLHNRKEILDEIIVAITDIISDLYDDRDGGFEVAATDRGPAFKVFIEGDRGGGISNMEIFCIDLAIFKLTSQKLRGPEFLIHDSHLFDGVDERQIAEALKLGYKFTTDSQLQYMRSCRDTCKKAQDDSRSYTQFDFQESALAV
ncbi:MAG: ABC-three component system protein [Thermosynechococcaceae cyanobacterium]